jgi:hypothetical protein
MTTMVMTVCVDRVLTFWNDNPCVEVPSSTWKHLEIIRNRLEVFGSDSEFQILPLCSLLWFVSWYLPFRCNCFVAVYKNRFCTCILIVNTYSQTNFILCFRNYLFSKNVFRYHWIWQTEWKILEKDVKQY